MKTLFVLFFGIVLGAVAYYLYCAQPRSITAPVSDLNLTDKARDAAHDAANRTREVASNVGDSLNDKIRDWHLTREDIKADLAKTGEVVRHNAARVGEKISDTRIASVVRAKFVLDRDLSVHDLSVDCTEGNVTLTGTVANEALIGRAVAAALDTEGVQHVTARIKVARR